MTADDLRQDIEQTRRHLGETVDELAARADVKARVRARAAQVTGRISARDTLQRRWPPAMVAAGAAIVAVALRLRRRQA